MHGTHFMSFSLSYFLTCCKFVCFPLTRTTVSSVIYSVQKLVSHFHTFDLDCVLTVFKAFIASSFFIVLCRFVSVLVCIYIEERIAADS